jgi:uncharacterized phage protein gp47/JayE
MTFEEILERMLERVPEDIDKREGSIIYDALAPCAAELARMYVELEQALNESFADTASREYLVRRAAERGLAPYPATKAVLSARFTGAAVPVGARFSLDGLNYAVTAQNVVTCETAGTEGNKHFGVMLPIDFVDGLEYAEITALLVPGDDDEETEHFRKRYTDSLNSASFGGNITDYKEKTSALDGVGGVKVYPVWNGGGTVKLVIISSEYTAPASELVAAVQQAIDPTQDGRGVGIAPIGHRVTVSGVSQLNVNIAAEITFKDGWDFEGAKPYIEKVVEDYFAALAKEWTENTELTVRISRIETCILGCEGVLDIACTTLNGTAQNLVLGADEIPLRGEISCLT